jgi:hypothetical protein
VPENPLELKVQIDPASVVSGQPIIATAEASGGFSPYSYHFRWHVIKNGYDYTTPRYVVKGSTVNTDQFLPDVKDDDKVELDAFVIDSTGRKALRMITIPVLSFAQVKGDANGDQVVDVFDLVSIIGYILSNAQASNMDNADANGDGKVDILDLVWIIDRIVE